MATIRITNPGGVFLGSGTVYQYGSVGGTTLVTLADGVTGATGDGQYEVNLAKNELQVYGAGVNGLNIHVVKLVSGLLSPYDTRVLKICLVSVVGGAIKGVRDIRVNGGIGSDNVPPGALPSSVLDPTTFQLQYLTDVNVIDSTTNDGYVLTWNHASGKWIASPAGGGGGGRSTYAAAVLADTPTLYYQCRDLSGTTCTDASGNGNNGTYIGPPLLGYGTLSGDTNDYAIHTNASTAGSYNGISTATLPNTSEFTVEGIFKCTDAHNTGLNGRMICTDEFGVAKGFAIAMNTTSGIYLNFNVTGSGSLNTVIAAQNVVLIGYDRVHIALVYSGTSLILYINGVPFYTQTGMTGTYIPSTTYSALYFGTAAVGSGKEPFIGAIDELALYNGVALSAARIRAHAQALFTQ